MIRTQIYLTEDAVIAKNADRIFVTLNNKHFPMLSAAEMAVPNRKN